ncbi:unnamed protein product [Moneuplotes crassus]|uniref:Uncharacterized protein n=1 Tax=Euplotes crassus TaxID=5936 RepID=A0AAD1UIK0_EUPCR|nr:unnamed protein product [Moneuplotes crassus]
MKLMRKSRRLVSIKQGKKHLVQQSREESKQSNGRQLSIHDFDFLSTLGTGTFGRVRLVRFKHDSKCDPMALKMLKKTEIIRLKQVDHVRSEKKILETIRHPFIVQLQDTFQTESHVFMLLDYACGGELFSLLRREGRFSNDVGLFFATEIVLAFEYLHSKEIAYRDLKPENLLVDKDGHVRITDFGFAKVVKDKTYTLCGTPEYLAPEIIQSKGHSKYVDWWALGVLIFEMLAGYPPFYDDNPLGIYQKILDGYYEFPPYVEPKAINLIKSFLTADKSIRLGCNRGSEEVKEHKWFKGVDWNVVYSREIPSPWVPKIMDNADTQYFEKYPDSVETPSVPTKA